MLPLSTYRSIGWSPTHCGGTHAAVLPALLPIPAGDGSSGCRSSGCLRRGRTRWGAEGLWRRCPQPCRSAKGVRTAPVSSGYDPSGAPTTTQLENVIRGRIGRERLPRQDRLVVINKFAWKRERRSFVYVECIVTRLIECRVVRKRAERKIFLGLLVFEHKKGMDHEKLNVSLIHKIVTNSRLCGD